MKKIKFYIGYDEREQDAYDALVNSMVEHCPDIEYEPIVLEEVQAENFMRREFYYEDGVMMDKISNHACSTKFSISRFLTLPLARTEGYEYAVFLDCDMIVTCDIKQAVLDSIGNGKAPVWCVKHDHNPDSDTKMDGQVQSNYDFKNWSSFVVYNVFHMDNDGLTLELVNTCRGIELHQFCWLKDKTRISELPIDMNFLVGYYPKTKDLPRNIHYTEGIPTMDGYADCDYASVWWDYYNETDKRTKLS